MADAENTLIAYVYPSNRNGRYVELVGKVIGVGEPLTDSVAITVETRRGTFTGYYGKPDALPKIGYEANVRVYEGGGGWYPDNEIVSWGPYRDKDTGRLCTSEPDITPSSCAEEHTP